MVKLGSLEDSTTKTITRHKASANTFAMNYRNGNCQACQLGIESHYHAGDDTWRVTSRSRALFYHKVDLRWATCTCEAGQMRRGKKCVHVRIALTLASEAQDREFEEWLAEALPPAEHAWAGCTCKQGECWDQRQMGQECKAEQRIEAGTHRDEPPPWVTAEDLAQREECVQCVQCNDRGWVRVNPCTRVACPECSAFSFPLEVASHTSNITYYAGA